MIDSSGWVCGRKAVSWVHSLFPSSGDYLLNPRPQEIRVRRATTLSIPLFALALAPTACAPGAPPGRPAEPPWTIPVLVLKYFPVTDDGRIDRAVTGDWGETLAFTRRKTDSLTAAVIKALEAGSAYHAYRDADARPSLRYEVLETIERLEPLPRFEKPGHDRRLTDYRAIVSAHGVRRWVEERGAKEVWIWGYHGGVIDLWESNMAGPWGDISNSDRDTTDLPVLSRTYTVYHYNYQRGASEAVENHMHQLEHLLNHVDGRDVTRPAAWDTLLFWGKFVGSDSSHRIVRPGCGWSHIPFNGEKDYAWANRRYVETDCEDWRPDGAGNRQNLNCERWGCQSLGWFVYWSQNIPGQASGLSYRGRPLRNWWIFVGDFDRAMREEMSLVEGGNRSRKSPR